MVHAGPSPAVSFAPATHAELLQSLQGRRGIYLGGSQWLFFFCNSLLIIWHKYASSIPPSEMLGTLTALPGSSRAWDVTHGADVVSRKTPAKKTLARTEPTLSGEVEGLFPYCYVTDSTVKQ